MVRLAIGLEYDGSNYHGWQLQPGLSTIQGVVEAALSRVADEPIKVVCAGRTDTGVHAISQVIHLDTQNARPMRAWVFGTNANLPPDVTVLWAVEVDEDFHARFSAQARRYRYHIYNRSLRPTHGRHHFSWQYRPLDETRMQVAADFLVGEHDFTSFRAIDCQAKSPIRTIQRFNVFRRGDIVTLDVTANAFLQHMVRNLAGVLMQIGCGKREPDWAKDVLNVKDRTLGGETAPPYGLYFTSIQYPKPYASLFPAVDADPLLLGERVNGDKI